MMLNSLLIGLAAGTRSLTPIAAVSDAARRGALHVGDPRLSFLAQPGVSLAIALLAAGEAWGDKLRAAPDRIAPAGILARILTGGLSGAALAPRRRAGAGALLGATAAVGAAYITFALRMSVMARFGQTPTGLVEDAVTLTAARAIVRRA